MASAAANRRRIQQNQRVPSIEVYSAPGTTRGTPTGVEASPSSGRTNRLTAGAQQQQTYLATEYRILSSSSASRSRANQARYARISSSKSTGNLSVDEKEPHGPHCCCPKSASTVQHASSHGMLSSTRQAKSQDNSRTTSPHRPTNLNVNGRRQHSQGSNVSPARNMIAAGKTANRRGRLINQRSQLSVDDSLDYDDDEEFDAGKPDNHANIPQEPVTVLGNTIRPTTHETTARRIDIRYSARTDRYKRVTDPTRMRYAGWNSLVYAERNIEWITEHCRDQSGGDAVMTYISRKPGTPNAYIEWRFDFSDIGMKIKKLFLKFPYETFEDGHVKAYLKPEGSSDTIPVYSSLLTSEVVQMRNWNRFSLIAELCCERESCAFQHAQLFRQTLKSSFFDKQEDKYQFKIEIELYSMY